MGKVKLRPDLNEVVARMVLPSVNETAEFVADKARAFAPPTKTWRSQRDAKVREPHVHADGQVVPDNLRFQLTAYQWDLQHPGAVPVERARGDGSGWDGPTGQTVPGSNSWLTRPRDHTSGHLIQTLHCRCYLEVDPRGVAKMVTVKRATVPKGTKVVAKVVAEGAGVMGAEYGEIYPFPVTEPVADGTMFMHRAADAARNELRARR